MNNQIKKEIELYNFNNKDSEMLSELIMEYLSEKGIHAESFSYQIKVFIDSETDQLDED